jgi:hypothetical protein
MTRVVRCGVAALAAGILMLGGWGCQQTAAHAEATTTRPPTTRTGGRHPLQAVEYVRTGGFAGTHDVITVKPDGEIHVEGRLAGKRSGRLTPEQRDELADLFDGWDKLAKDYAEAPANDTYQYTIRYGDHTVASGQLSKVPPQFAQVRDRLEKLAQSLPDQATR